MQNPRLDATFITILSICSFAMGLISMQRAGIWPFTMSSVTGIVGLLMGLVGFGVGVVIFIYPTNQKILTIVRTIGGWLFAIVSIYWFFILLT